MEIVCLTGWMVKATDNFTQLLVNTFKEIFVCESVPLIPVHWSRRLRHSFVTPVLKLLNGQVKHSRWPPHCRQLQPCLSIMMFPMIQLWLFLYVFWFDLIAVGLQNVITFEDLFIFVDKTWHTSYSVYKVYSVLFQQNVWIKTITENIYGH